MKVAQKTALRHQVRANEIKRQKKSLVQRDSMEAFEIDIVLQKKLHVSQNG